MQRLTSPEQLDQLAGLLDREAGQLDHVLARLRGQVAATHGCWEGRVADSFRSHTGHEHRQHHLRLARDRLREAARLARLAADENRTAPPAAERRQSA
ncbi:MAG: WXG100 family type VII secretion target [Pseudonocardiaceae bacterium]